MKLLKICVCFILMITLLFSYNTSIDIEKLAFEKMNRELIDLMLSVSDTTKFSVLIELKDNVPQDELQKALDEVFKKHHTDDGDPKLLVPYDIYASERLDVLKSFYYPHNYSFLEKYGLTVEGEESVSAGVPYIHHVTVNKEIVMKMLYDSEVISIVHFSINNEYEF